jgi:hypothetical protein
VLAPGLLDGRVVLLSSGGSGRPRDRPGDGAVGALVVFMTNYPRSVVEEAASTVPLHVDASGSIVAEARPNGRCGQRART